jgi:hypothetical protein
MTLKKTLVAYLLGKSEITALISRRFYYDNIPYECKYPAVLCFYVSDVKLHTLTGQSTLEQPNVQFSVHADTDEEAEEVANQLKNALSDYQGDMNGLYIQYIKLLNELPSEYKNEDGTIVENIYDLEYEINFTKE